MGTLEKLPNGKTADIKGKRVQSQTDEKSDLSPSRTQLIVSVDHQTKQAEICLEAYLSLRKWSP